MYATQTELVAILSQWSGTNLLEVRNLKLPTLMAQWCSVSSISSIGPVCDKAVGCCNGCSNTPCLPLHLQVLLPLLSRMCRSRAQCSHPIRHQSCWSQCQSQRWGNKQHTVLLCCQATAQQCFEQPARLEPAWLNCSQLRSIAHFA